MSINSDNICRLCFASGSSRTDICLISIKEHLPFLESLANISQDDQLPQKICSSCEMNIEMSQQLRKKVQFTDKFWTKFNQRNLKASLEILLNCHLCGLAFDYAGLQSHIESTHEENHILDCDFCLVLLEKDNFKHIDVSDLMSQEISDLVPSLGQSEEPGETSETAAVTPHPPQNLDIHVEVEYLVDENGDEQMVFSCQFCGTSGNYKGAIMNHVQTQHQVTEVHIREEPGRSDSGQFAEDPKCAETQSCEYCGEISDNIYNHIRLMHTTTRIDGENDKGEKFTYTKQETLIEKNKSKSGNGESSNSATISNDMRFIYNSDKRIYECTVCEQSSNTSYNMRRHIEIVHRKVYQDEGSADDEITQIPKKPRISDELIITEMESQEEPSTAGQNNSNAMSSLRDSMRVKIGKAGAVVDGVKYILIDGQRIYECSVCGKSSKKSNNMRRHVKSVHGKVEFYGGEEEEDDGCQDFDVEVVGPDGRILMENELQFKSVEDTIAYFKDSTGKRNFKCIICGKITLQRSNATRHVRAIHKDIKFET